VVTLLTAGCQTIYFERGASNVARATSQRQWHHGGGIFGLIEFSNPYDPKARCADSEWQAVKVDLTFLTGLVGALVPYGIYTPWEVGVVCRQ